MVLLIAYLGVVVGEMVVVLVPVPVLARLVFLHAVVVDRWVVAALLLPLVVVWDKWAVAGRLRVGLAQQRCFRQVTWHSRARLHNYRKMPRPV